MHDHALYLHVLSSSLSRQTVERSSTFAEKVTFQLRFLLTSADIYHCLFGGPLALCLLISFHINSCVFDKITVFVPFLTKESKTWLCAWQFKRRHASAGQTGAHVPEWIQVTDGLRQELLSQINVCPYFPREDVFPVSHSLTHLLPPWFYGEADPRKGRLVCTKHRSQKALYLSVNGI